MRTVVEMKKAPAVTEAQAKQDTTMIHPGATRGKVILHPAMASADLRAMFPESDYAVISVAQLDAELRRDIERMEAEEQAAGHRGRWA